MLVDEGACVFARQKKDWIAAGQHCVGAEDVRVWVNHCLVRDGRLLVFVDPNQRAGGSTQDIILPKGTSYTLPASMFNLRNPARVRDVAIPHYSNPEKSLQVQSLRNERILGDKIQLVEVKMPVSFTNRLYRAENEFMVTRWGNIVDGKETDMNTLRDWALEMQDKCATHLATVLIDKVRGLQANSKKLDSNILMQLAVLCPGPVTRDSPVSPAILRRKTLSALRAQTDCTLASEIAQVMEDQPEVLYFGSVEDFVGLERALVIVTGFTNPIYVKHRLEDLNEHRFEMIQKVHYYIVVSCLVHD